jgi:hypothetical protein
MMRKKKVEYQSPQMSVVETIMCNMLCASIEFSNDEINTQGRVNKRKEVGAWSEEMWSQKHWE